VTHRKAEADKYISDRERDAAGDMLLRFETEVEQ